MLDMVRRMKPLVDASVTSDSPPAKCSGMTANRGHHAVEARTKGHVLVIASLRTARRF